MPCVYAPPPVGSKLEEEKQRFIYGAHATKAAENICIGVYCDGGRLFDFIVQLGNRVVGFSCIRSKIKMPT